MRALGLGYRAPYIYETVRAIEGNIEYIKSLDSKTCRKELLKYKGIGAKVADCILLFSLESRDSYPVDTWVFKACRTKELDTVQKVSEYYKKRYGKEAGYAQQYAFYYARENKIGIDKNSKKGI